MAATIRFPGEGQNSLPSIFVDGAANGLSRIDYHSSIAYDSSRDVVALGFSGKPNADAALKLLNEQGVSARPALNHPMVQVNPDQLGKALSVMGVEESAISRAVEKVKSQSKPYLERKRSNKSADGLGRG